MATNVPRPHLHLRGVNSWVFLGRSAQLRCAVELRLLRSSSRRPIHLQLTGRLLLSAVPCAASVRASSSSVWWGMGTVTVAGP
eukprot:scaffold17434_cov114-Isochrysis_galbana.AAC.5